MQRVPSKPDFVGLEHEVLQRWERERRFDALKQQIAGRPMFRFVDGPITANNPMGVHHAWGRTLKDAFIRYKVMRGHDCRFQNGFDCQGLWVEVEVEKALGFNGKPDIERFGLDRFAEACKQRIERFAGVITEQSKRLGQWMDWPDSYYTHRDANITGIWHFLRICHERGWIYQKGLPMPWCPRCGTSLSEHEMAGSYKDVAHLAIYGQVPLLSDRTRRLLVWTTTPWTLSSNVAAAVHPDLTYIEVKANGWDHSLILCEGAKRALAGTGARVVGSFPGRDLVGLEYETFHPDLEPQKPIVHRVVPWDAVDAAEGSGIVHIAPGCGKEDYELGRALGLPLVAPVDDNGNFLAGFGFLTGHNAQDVARVVADDLERQGKLFKAEAHEHSYPVCWRCKGELIFRLVDEWFIACDEIRPEMKRAAAQVAWTPEHMGKRMDNWLDLMGDWCISRKRYWGLPLPFYVCGCGVTTVVGSRAELRERAVDKGIVDGLPELHRPWIDEVKIHCPACNAVVSRVPEVGDCWLDAGIVPYSTTGYFDDKAAFARNYPTEWVCEMREQIRLWFYSMLFMGTAISGRAPYEKVLAYERVIAEDGTRFSKTGFMIHFDEAVEKMGADAMRWVYCRQPVGADVRFGYHSGEVAQRKLATLWSVYSFYVTYALIDQPDVAAPLDAGARTVSDAWLLARTAKMIEVATASFEAWDTPAALAEVEDYLDDLSNWYVRINRRRFWKNTDTWDREAAYGTLYRALEATLLVLAPVAPFLVDAIWTNLVGRPASVHQAAWPEVPGEWADPGLLARTARVRAAISLGLNLRERANLRVRQPLSTAFVVCDDPGALEEQLDTIGSELNVERVVVSSGTSDFTDPSFALDFKAAGPVLRKDVNRVKELLAGLGVEARRAVAAALDGGATAVEIAGWDSPVPASILVRSQVARAGVEVAADGGITVALDTTLTPALERAGLARDLVRKLQVMRKDADLDVSDRISVFAVSTSPELTAAIDAHKAMIAEEVLGTWVERVPDHAAAREATDVLGHPVDLAIRKI